MFGTADAPRRRGGRRRGAALVEAAITMATFLTLVFGMIDLAIALFRKHVATEAARQGARAAIVHGSLAPASSGMNAWGPTPAYLPAPTSQSLYASSTSHSVQADDASDEFAAAIRPYLVGVDPGTVTLTIAWPDGDNAPGSRVTVSVDVAYPNPIGFLSGATTVDLGASSTMTVAH
jgi:Flp pilus assembly protein TadG